MNNLLSSAEMKMKRLQVQKRNKNLQEQHNKGFKFFDQTP